MRRPAPEVADDVSSGGFLALYSRTWRESGAKDNCRCSLDYAVYRTDTKRSLRLWFTLPGAIGERHAERPLRESTMTQAHEGDDAADAADDTLVVRPARPDDRDAAL